MKDAFIEEVQKDVNNEQKYRDGIPRIAGGLFLIVTMLMQMNGNGNAFVVFIPLMPILIESLRKRITYPRVGYAKVREPRLLGKPILWAILAMLIAGALVFIFKAASPKSLPNADNSQFLLMWVGAITVLFLGIIFVTRRRNISTTWSAIGVIAITISILAFNLKRETVYIVVMLFGASLVISGLFSLRSLIKEYPVLKDE